MFHVPVTFLFDFEHVDDCARPFIFENFAAAGAKHMVLTDTLISAIFQRRDLAETLQNEIAAAGMSFADAHAPFGKEIDMIVMDPEYRKRAVLRQKLAIATAAQMGVDTITFHLGSSYRWPGIPLAKHRENAIDFISRLLPAAEEYGVVICIENIWAPNNASTAELNAILNAFDSKYLGFCYDAGHANLMRSASAVFENSAALSRWREAGYDNVEWNDHILEDMLPNIVNCHLHDNDGQWDQHRNIGHGSIDWKRVIPLLKRAPRLKNIQSEVIPCRGQESIVEICAAFRKLGEF